MKFVGNLVRRGYGRFIRWRNYANSRNYADKLRREIVSINGSRFVGRKIKREIKNYAESFFGNSEYWHWLALYAEIRKEFLEGWIGEDYYRYILLPSWNDPVTANLSMLKTFDHRLFPGMTIRPVGVRVSGCYFTADRKPISEEEFERLIRSYNGEIVIKRDWAGSGKDIRFMEPKEFSVKELNIDIDYIIQPSVRQHPDLGRIHQSSVNTLRITTFRTITGKIEVKHRSMRVGAAGGRIVNSYGGFFFLNSEGAGFTNAYNDFGHDLGGRHPDTNFRYRDFRLDSIKEAEQLCIKAHLNYPYVRFIGWDLYIDQNKKPVLIEWNTRPDIWVNEAVIGPLWKKEELTGKV